MLFYIIEICVGIFVVVRYVWIGEADLDLLSKQVFFALLFFKRSFQCWLAPTPRAIIAACSPLFVGILMETQALDSLYPYSDSFFSFLCSSMSSLYELVAQVWNCFYMDNRKLLYSEVIYDPEKFWEDEINHMIRMADLQAAQELEPKSDWTRVVVALVLVSASCVIISAVFPR